MEKQQHRDVESFTLAVMLRTPPLFLHAQLARRRGRRRYYGLSQGAQLAALMENKRLCASALKMLLIYHLFLAA
ncbi:MAG: hypothetical protein IKS20_14170 [Victivallales bacterium]|nr:hypothetical protein [Victivallales bacterium]